MKKNIAGIIFAFGFVLFLFSCSEIIIPMEFLSEVVFRTIMLCLGAVCFFVTTNLLKEKESSNEMSKVHQTMDEAGRQTKAHENNGHLSI